jgi:UDP-N-acetylmuramoylalanine-D-glutamate ligase
MVLQQLYGRDYDRTLLMNIEPVAHRLQPIILDNGLTIIDDSVSSSAHALSAAISAMMSPVVLIS